MKTIDIILASSLVVSSSVLGGCLKSAGTDNTDSAESALDSSDSVSDESDMMIASADGVSTASGLTAVTADAVSATIAANIAARWPGGCAVATATGASVAVQYTDCTGPRGLLHVTGELDLTVAVSVAGAISIHGEATDLEVNNATLDFTADGTYSATGTMQTLAVTANGSGTGPRGNSIDHNGNYTVSWDSSSQCRTIDGSWSTDLTSAVATAERANTVNITRCGTSCPTGTLAHKFLGGASLTVTFDSTATAGWSTSTGLSGTVALTCTPE